MSGTRTWPSTTGSSIDFVDVPGHDRLVGNMLVGAGEIDAALLVVAADDGPRPQTLEHLELLDALGIRRGLAVVTKADLVDPGRAADELRTDVRALLAGRRSRACRCWSRPRQTGEGIDEVRAALAALRADARRRRPADGRLAIDRVFAVRGRGAVVTGSLRGGPVRAR